MIKNLILLLVVGLISCAELKAKSSDDDSLKHLFNLDCGNVTYATGFVVGGTVTDRGQWPFLAALYHLERMSFFCGGTLISTKHVLTAAHCIKYKHSRSSLTVEELSVFLGRYNLDAQAERGAVARDVKSIHVHPEWKVNSEKWDADLAVLVLTEAVSFTQYIQPVCVPASAAIDHYDEGTVVGWGKSESEKVHENIPRQVSLKTVSGTNCYTENPKIAIISTNRTFCAIGENSGPCHGDGGGGYFVKVNSLWIIKGIVSNSLLKPNLECDVETYSIYTTISDFTAWIKSTVDQNS